MKFPIVEATRRRERRSAKAGGQCVIWTTTPWTIPGNRAISYSPRIAYGLYQVEAIAARSCSSSPGPSRATSGPGRQARRARSCSRAKSRTWTRLAAPSIRAGACLRPSVPRSGYDFDVPLLAGDHVTDDAGTGFVHTAPGHGADDFNIWIAHSASSGIPFTVDEDGRFTKEAPGFEGLKIIQLEGKNTGKDGPANKAVIEKLIEAGALLARGQLKHHYPHSWRSQGAADLPQHAAMVHRARQAYAAGGGQTLRQVALREIERVDWGQRRLNDDRDQNRIKAMIEERPDWLISRQRNWGVPLAIFVSKADAVDSAGRRVDARIIAAMRRGRRRCVVVDAGAGFPGRQIPGRGLRESRRHPRCLVRFRLNARFRPGDREQPTRLVQIPASVLYLEGSDQHRGWFHSSLLESCATRGRAPYDEVITYGFTVAEDGRKMSKSLGNGVEPQEVEKQYGIEPFRLLIAAADYRDELRFGPDDSGQATEMYRKLRNTHPLLPGRAEGFRGKRASAALRRHARCSSAGFLHRLWQLDGAVREAYAAYQFRAALSAIVEFLQRRSLGLLCRCPQGRALLRCAEFAASPRLPLGAGRGVFAPHRMACADPAVHDGGGVADAFPATTSQCICANFRKRPPPGATISRRRNGPAPASARGRHRRAGSGAARQAHWLGARSGADCLCRRRDVLASLKSVDFAELCITSAVTLKTGEGPAEAFRLPDAPGIAVVVEKASGVKCARSWKYFDPLTAYRKYPDITPRDADAVAAWDAARGRG